VVGEDAGTHPASGGAGVRHDIGEVQLALGVTGLQAGQPFGEGGCIEDVDAGVDLGQVEFRVGGVGLLDDAGHLVPLTDDPAIAGRVWHHGREHRDGVGAGAVGGDQVLQRLSGEQRDVTGGDDHLARDAGKGCEAGPHRVPGAEWTLLDGDHDMGGDLREVGAHLLALVTDDDHEPVRHERVGTVDGQRHQRLACDAVEHLGDRRLHPGAGSGGHDHHGCHPVVDDVVLSSHGHSQR